MQVRQPPRGDAQSIGCRSLSDRASCYLHRSAPRCVKRGSRKLAMDSAPAIMQVQMLMATMDGLSCFCMRSHGSLDFDCCIVVYVGECIR